MVDIYSIKYNIIDEDIVYSLVKAREVHKRTVQSNELYDYKDEL